MTKIFVTIALAAMVISCNSSKATSTENTVQTKSAQTEQRPGGQGGQGQQGQKPSTSELFTQMDADKDGVLAKSEVKGPLQNDFDTVDTNSDGYISKEELENAPKPEKGSRPQR